MLDYSFKTHYFLAMTITYSSSKDVNLAHIQEFYELSFKEKPRPTQDPLRMKSMIEATSLFLTAWDENKLIGICRSLSDFAYVSYISDLAVHPDYQKQGIAKQLIALTQEKSGAHCKIVILSNIEANSFYPHIGFTAHDRAWTLSTED